MKYLSKLLGTSKTEESPPEATADLQIDEKDAQYPEEGGQQSSSEEEIADGVDNSNPQYGVRSAAAALKVWSKWQLIAVYVIMWLIEFLLAFQSGMAGTLNNYVTSAFQKQSLTATTSVISSLVAGLVKLPFAKLMDIWGRPHSLAIMIVSITIGLIMMAACNNVGTYLAAQIFYSTGYNCIDFCITIFIADTSSLRNRAFVIAFVSSPWIATVWATGPAAQSALKTIGWRWVFGIFSILVPVVCFPLWALFYYNHWKAEKEGLIVRERSGRTWMQSFKHYMIEFDVVGLLLLAGGLALFLLAFNLYSYQPKQWREPFIIAFIVVGGVLMFIFALYERYLAPITFIPWDLLKNRTIIFTYIMVASLYTPYYIWDDYFYALLIVVFNTGVTVATYIGNIYSVGSCFWSIVFGLVLRYNGRVKWHAVFFGVPITILGVGLMIHFRYSDSGIGYIAMCMIFVAFGGGTLVICEQINVMAAAPQKYVASVLSLESMITSIGAAVGSTISSAMWTGIFPKKLVEYLPADAPFEEIYGSLVVQASYPPGSPIRTAINHAYGETQRYMLITATCMYIITWGSVLFWQDFNVKKMKKQNDRLF